MTMWDVIGQSDKVYPLLFGRAFGTHTHYFFQNHLVLLRCLYCTKLAPISKIADVPRAERVVA